MIINTGKMTENEETRNNKKIKHIDCNHEIIFHFIYKKRLHVSQTETKMIRILDNNNNLSVNFVQFGTVYLFQLTIVFGQ